MHSATILGRSINTEFIDEGTLFYGKTNWRKHQADYDGLIGLDYQILSPYQILMDHSYGPKVMVQLWSLRGSIIW